MTTPTTPHQARNIAATMFQSDPARKVIESLAQQVDALAADIAAEKLFSKQAMESVTVHDAGHPGTAFRVQAMCIDPSKPEANNQELIMSADASREAFEAWWQSPDSTQGTHKRMLEAAWQASRKQALEDAASLCHDAATNDPTLTARFCAHALKALK